MRERIMIVLGMLLMVVAVIAFTGLHSAAADRAPAPAIDNIPVNGTAGPSTVTAMGVVPVTPGTDGDLMVGSDRAEPNASYRTITDSVGRKVTIPATITRVLGSTSLVYLIAPEKVGGWDLTALTNETRKFYSALPANITNVSSSSSNYEAYIALHPDLIFISCGDGNAIRADAVNLTQEKYGKIPVVCLNNTQNVTNAGSAFRFMGQVLGNPERADELTGYYEGVLGEVRTKVSAIPKDQRVRVYYAEGANGLSTDASGSIHSQLIDLCGGNNVAAFKGLQSGSGMTAVTMESVLMWNPEMIITNSRDFAAMAYNDSTWQQIPAVKNHRVYVTPSQPASWFDRPPSFMRIVGIPWTAHVLYPDRFPEDWMEKKVKEYFSLYYHYDLSDDELAALLSPSAGSNISSMMSAAR
jgi:iron complex transport system substrate-binding protein